jgi:hypothetical protein
MLSALAALLLARATGLYRKAIVQMETAEAGGLKLWSLVGSEALPQCRLLILQKILYSSLLIILNSFKIFFAFEHLF